MGKKNRGQKPLSKKMARAQRRETAANGLRLLWIAGGVSILALVPRMRGILSAVGFILICIGTWKLRKVSRRYRLAGRALALAFAAALLLETAGFGIARATGQKQWVTAGLAGLILAIFAGSAVWDCCLCTATAEELRAVRAEREAAKGRLVWKLSLGSSAAGLALSTVPVLMRGTQLVPAAVIAAVGLAGSVPHLMFLYRSERILRKQGTAAEKHDKGETSNGTERDFEQMRPHAAGPDGDLGGDQGRL